MIFENGELRPIASNKPRLYDGWDYTPIEPNPPAIDTNHIPVEKPVEPDSPTPPISG